MLVYLRVLSLAFDSSHAICCLWTISLIIGTLITVWLLTSKSHLSLSLSLLSPRSTYPVSHQVPYSRPTPNMCKARAKVHTEIHDLFSFSSHLYSTPCCQGLLRSTCINILAWISKLHPFSSPKATFFGHSLGLGVLHDDREVHSQEGRSGEEACLWAESRLRPFEEILES